MRQPLSSLTRWVVSSVLPGLETGPIADPLVGSFLDVDGSDAGHIVGAHVPGVVPSRVRGCSSASVYWE